MPADVFKSKKISIGFDPNLFTKQSLNMLFGKSKCTLKPLINNLIDEIWSRKVKKNKNKFFTLPEKSISEKYTTKINKIF